jgi:hypothetical protein
VEERLRHGAGFSETIDSAASILAAIRRLQDKKMLPPFPHP